MKKNFTRSVSIVMFLLFSAIVYINLTAFDDGIVGLTKRAGNVEGCTCHNFEPSPSVNVDISGPSIVRPGDTVSFQMKVSGGPHLSAGCDISTVLGKLILSPLDTMLQRMEAEPGAFELTHVWPKLPVNDTITFIFRYIAPNTNNVKDTIFANGNSVNLSGDPTGDMWNYAVSKIITVQTVSVNNQNQIVNSFSLGQNYPNPFNPSTKISYSLNKDGLVFLKVFDVLGKEVAVLVNGYKQAGTYHAEFNSHSINGVSGSGVYFYTIEVNGVRETKKMIFLK